MIKDPRKEELRAQRLDIKQKRNKLKQDDKLRDLKKYNYSSVKDILEELEEDE